MIRGFEYINNSHCKVYLPFVNSATENKANGASHVVTNNGVAIRTLSDYSIPDCPNGAKKAAYFDGSSYLTIPYSDDFDYFGKQPLTYRVWIYTPDKNLGGNCYICSMFKESGKWIALGFNTNAYIDYCECYSIIYKDDDIYSQNNNNNKYLYENEWTLLEFTFFDTRGGLGNNYSYINGFGDISTNSEIKREIALNVNFYIGAMNNSDPIEPLKNFYMSEFQIFKGLARPRPGTYNPTNNQKYYTLPSKML